METMIKIGADGQPLPADATQWDAVLLPHRGLMFSASNVSDDELTADQADQACAGLSLAGFTDWRVPTRPELEAILDLTRYEPAIDPTYFRDTHSDWYRTSTPCAWSSGSAWFVLFGSGLVDHLRRNSSAFVRAVRVVSPAGQ